MDCAQHERGLKNEATQIHFPMDCGSALLGTMSMHADQLAARVSFVARMFRHTSKDPFSQCELYKEFAYRSKLSK